MRNDELGNPLLVAAGAKALSDNSPAILKGASRLGLLALIAGGGYFGYKAIKNRHRNNLMKRAGTNPEVQAAMNLFSAIPAGLKTGKGGLFNPFGFVSDVGNKVALVWKRTDTDRILAVAQSVHNSKLDLKKVYDHFYTIYGQQLYTLLNVALDADDLAKFNNYAKTGSVSQTANVATRMYAVTKVNSLNVRKTPENMQWTQVFTASNKVGTVPFAKLVGLTTGKEVHDKENDVVFVELTVWGNDNKTYTAYAWKGGLEFFDHSGLAKRFNKSSYADVLQSILLHRFDGGGFSGFNGENEPLKEGYYG